MSSDAHEPKHGELLAYAQGQLSPEGVRQLGAHLTRCAVCREALRTVRTYTSLVEDARAIAPPVLDWARMQTALRREQATARREGMRVPFAVGAVLLAAAAAVLAPKEPRRMAGVFGVVCSRAVAGRWRGGSSAMSKRVS